MRYKIAAFLVFFLTNTASCGTMRTIEICQIRINSTTTMNSLQDCAKGDKKYKKKLSELNKSFVLQEKGLRKIGDKLEECERNADECED